MKHRKKQTKLSRTVAHRKSMISNMTSSLILNEYVVTTTAKAKAVKSFFDKVASYAKKNKKSGRRRLEKLLRNKVAVDKLLEYLTDRFDEREGGFTQMVRVGTRKGDNAQLSKLIIIGSKPFKEVKKVKVKEEKKSKKKKDKGKKKGFLDKVRGIGRGSGEELKEDQTKKKDIRGRSRSGI